MIEGEKGAVFTRIAFFYCVHKKTAQVLTCAAKEGTPFPDSVRHAKEA
jgi:hypothetical protein